MYNTESNTWCIERTMRLLVRDLGDASVSVIITSLEYVSIKLVPPPPSRIFYSTQSFRNEIRKKRAFSAAVARQVHRGLYATQWGILFSNDHTRVDSPPGNVMESGSPIPAAEQSRGHRSGSAGRCQARSPPRGTGSCWMHIAREKPFSET